MPQTVRTLLGSQPTWHSNMMRITENVMGVKVKRPGKTNKERSKGRKR